MANGMSSMNSALGGQNLDSKQLSTEAVRTASDMKAVIDEFTAGMHSASAARYRATLGEYSKFEELRSEIAKKSSISRMENELKNFQGSVEARKQLERDLAEEEKRVADLTVRAIASQREHAYKNATAIEKAEMRKQNAEAIKNNKLAIKQKYDEEWAAAEGDGRKRAALTRKYRKDMRESVKAERDERMASIKLQQSAVAMNLKHTNKDMNAMLKHPSLKNIGKFAFDLAVIGGKDLAKVIDGLKGVHQAAREELEAREQELSDARERYGEDSPEYQEAQKAVIEARKQKDIAAATEAMANAIQGMKDSFNTAFKEAEDMLTSYMGKIDARLQGSETSYKEAMGKISTNLSVSPYVKSKAAIENMTKMVEQGIAYNLEQRSFLATVSDKIANTFDAFDSNLARLIRLQQADTTAARLGMEAALTQFLNGMYQDTSYMSGAMDNVSSTLIDASSTMTRDMSAQFEYTIHKWMGSLSSVGMSDETINQIVTGIGYLATGDVQNLSNNTQLTTLLAMSASKAGLEYSELLLKGLDDSSTNRLLEAMVSYLKEIAEGSDNQVVRAAYGDVFNLSMSDMKAISNLRATDIQNIAANSLTYSGMEAELTSQFSALIQRTSISEMMSNLYENAVFGVAEDLVSDPITYSMYKMLQFMKDQDLDINIPFVNAMGFGLDLNATVQDFMELGVGISSAFSLLTNIIGGLGSGGGLNLDAWGGSEYTSRGSGTSFSTSANAGAVSGSTYIASGSGTDMQNSTLNSATDDAAETAKVTNKNSDPGKTIDDFFKATVSESKDGGHQRTQDQVLLAVHNNDTSEYLHTRDSRMLFDPSRYLYTRDETLYNYFSSHVFGTDLLVTDKRLNVSAKLESDAEAIVRVYDSQVLEAIKNMGTFSSSMSINSISDGAASAIANKIGTKLGGGNTLKNVYDLFSTGDGRAHVRIQNEDHKRLQVDTEQMLATQDAYDKFGYNEDETKLNVKEMTAKGIVW